MEKYFLSVNEWVQLVSQDKNYNLPIWFKVVGNSMYPFIRANIDDVMLVPVKHEELKIGDIVLFPGKYKGGDYCLHRIYKMDGDKVQTFGDGNCRPDRWISKTSIIGKAVLIKRGEKNIDCESKKWKKRFKRWTSLWRLRRILLLPFKVVDKLKRINGKKYLKWLSKITAPVKTKLAGLFVLNAIVSASSVIISIINKNIVDEASNQLMFKSLVILMAGLQLFSILGGLVETLLESFIAEKYACVLRSSLLKKLLNTSWKNRAKYHSEEILSRITSDVEQITAGVSQFVISVGGLFVKLGLAFAILWSYSHTLAIIIIIIVPVGVLIFALASFGLKKVQLNFQQTEADYRIFLQERLSKIDIVQVFGQEEATLKKLENIQDKRLTLIRKKNWWKVLSSGIIGVTFAATYAVAFVSGAIMIKDGNITFGIMTAFLSLVGQIQGPVYALAKKIPQIVSIFASSERIMEVSEFKNTEHNSDIENNLFVKKTISEGTFLGLEAKNLSVKYDDDDIIKNLSFKINPGEMVMLTGSSGVGKTTLLRSIMGFLPASGGTVSFFDENGNICSCGADTRKCISYVPQGNTLMYGSILENLLIGNAGATREQMFEALRIADALEFVQNLPEGIDTVIGEKAVGVSEGQAQRIAIARALLKPSGFLILDEATSSLDENTEARILEAITQSNHATCLFVSHRKYLKKYADQIIDISY